MKIMDAISQLTENKIPTNRLVNSDVLSGLALYEKYDREQISQIFEPGSKFVPQAGRWGISGIIETPKESGNFIFLVTLGKPVDSNPYRDAITQDGYVIWESQSRQDFESSTIKKLLDHSPDRNNIHLFLRPRAGERYTYFGLLRYESHDPHQVRPVHFVWRLLDWNLSSEEMELLEIPFDKPLLPTFSAPERSSVPVGKLMMVQAPKKLANQPERRDIKTRAQNTERSVDWAERDERNRQLGLLGEKYVLQFEIDSLLSAGRPDLANQVKHVALIDAAAGYDILSYAPNGNVKHIEVKTTKGPANTPFFISANEIAASNRLSDTFWIYRLFEVEEGKGTVQFFRLAGPADISCELTPTAFRASPALIQE